MTSEKEKNLLRCREAINESCKQWNAFLTVGLLEPNYCPMVGIKKRCDGSCDTIDETFSRFCVVNKSDIVMLNVLNKMKMSNY